MSDAVIVEIEKYLVETVTFLPKLAGAIVIFLVFWIISLILKGMVTRYGNRVRLNEDVRDLLARVVRVGVIVIGLVTALGTIDIDVTAMVAGLGLTGFALGFALQDIISNVLAGVLILMHRPFRRGNYIKIGDKEGTVVDMDLRYTTLQRENLKILIPNSALFKEAITIIMAVAPKVPSIPPEMP